MRFIHIANGDDVRSVGLINHAEQILAALAGPDGPHANPIVRAQNAAVRSGRGKGRSHEDPAIGFADCNGHGRLCIRRLTEMIAVAPTGIDCRTADLPSDYRE
jgi:hypothetical protein